tara:strand:+ start:2147 stop:2893 length:747 start_codon:yes stop_codon:yes gene_type:complete
MEKQNYLNLNINETVDLILPAYNEEKSIKKCINNFESLNLFSNIIIIDNNSSDNTKNEIKKTKAKYIFEKKQGYGAAIKRGIIESNSEIIIICEPDLTFSHNDIYKFLAYLSEFDCVFGTRTSKSMIELGAKMSWYLRYGNIIVAKFLEYLFNGPSLTDVGCSFKAFKKKTLKNIIHQLNVDGSHFQPELMIRLIQKKYKIIEIPVFYLKREGYSKITYSFSSSLRVAIRMVVVIIKIFILNFFSRKD